MTMIPWDKLAGALGATGGVITLVMHDDAQAALRAGLETSMVFAEEVSKIKDISVASREEYRQLAIAILEHYLTILRSADLSRFAEAERKEAPPAGIAFVVGQPYGDLHKKSGLTFTEALCYRCTKKIVILPATMEKVLADAQVRDKNLQVKPLCSECFSGYDLRNTEIKDMRIGIPL